MYKVISEFSRDVLYQGTKSECNAVIKAFNRYGIADRKIILVEPEKWMSTDLKDKIKEELLYFMLDNNSSYDSIDDIKYGIYFEGIENMSDDTLYNDFASYVDLSYTERLATKLYYEAKAQKEIFDMLTEE